jgi:hypothetical protein
MTKLTADQIKEQAKRIAEGLERTKQPQGKGKIFRQIQLGDAQKRLETTGDPFFYGAFWDAFAPPGGIIGLRTFIWNPSHPNLASHVYIHVWIGAGIIDPVVGTFLSNVDTRFPRLTEPGSFGLRPGMMAPDTSGFEPNVMSLDFAIKVPAEIEPSNYVGNMCLMRLGDIGASDDIGQYLDRAHFVFKVLPLDRFRPD